MTWRGERSGGRRYNPAADERRSREERAKARYTRDKARLARLLKQFRKIELKGAEAQHAWGLPQLRSYTVGEGSDGVPFSVIIRSDNGRLFLQEPGYPAWTFYRLVPRYHHPREGSSRDCIGVHTHDSRVSARFLKRAAGKTTRRRKTRGR